MMFVFVVNFAVLRSVRRCRMGADADLHKALRQTSICPIARRLTPARIAPRPGSF